MVKDHRSYGKKGIANRYDYRSAEIDDGVRYPLPTILSVKRNSNFA